ncbi:MAG: phosphatidate cytidylyltransferase [Ilumatobacteraceae bacterium]
MSDDVWRRGRRGRDDDDDDFGPPLFGDDMTREMDDSDGLSFGDADTGPLPHWTEPPTGQLPSMLTQQLPEQPEPDHTDDLDVWSSFSNDAPVWSDDPAPTGEMAVPSRPIDRPDVTGEVFDDGDDASAPVRRGPGRITIGTDPTDDRMGRPMPKKSARSGRVDPSRGPVRPVRPTGAPGSSRGPAPSSRDMPTAVAVGLIIAAAFIGALLLAPWAVLAIVVAILALAAVEFFDKVTETGYRPATTAGIAAAATLPLAAYWVGETAIPLVVVFAFAAATLTFVSSNGLESSPLPNAAITTLGVVWIGVLGSFAALILSASTVTGGVFVADGFASYSIGTDTLFLLALGVVANDVGALFIGSAAGRTPLRAWISPNKTIEGFLGGTIMTLLAMVVVGVAGSSSTWNSTGDLLILGIVISLMAPLGDLTESMFKRNLDIKDFGSLVKGHGGVLDRFDGFLFTLPAVYYLMLVLEPWVTK